jgi:pyochelin biosynthetic protein PchC
MTSSEVFDRWFNAYHPSPAADVTLICFPAAGGSSSAFFSLSAALPSSVEAWAVQLPGRQDRRHEEAYVDIAPLADALVDRLDGRLDRPYVLFGHSMGAVVGFEVARRLEAGQGPAPERLVVSGRRAPSTVRDEQVHLRDDAGVVAELRLLSGTDPVFLRDPELLAMILPAIRADYQAVETYRCVPDAAVACPITAFVGNRDPRTSIDEARAWSAHTKGVFDLQVFAGGHFFIEDRLPELVAALGVLAVGAG